MQEIIGKVFRLMRVISGKKRGLKLNPPREDMPVRPTADRVKEAVFNLLQSDLEGPFLDLFAGSGQMGIEALSRGIEKVVLCDNDENSVALIKSNLKKSGFEKDGIVFFGDYRKYLKTTSLRFKTVFVDPPYDRGLSQRALETLGAENSCLLDNALVVVECLDGEKLPESVGRLSLYCRRKYGIAAVYVYICRNLPTVSDSEDETERTEI